MADVPDSKSGPRKRVWVQVPPSVLGFCVDFFGDARLRRFCNSPALVGVILAWRCPDRQPHGHTSEARALIKQPRIRALGLALARMDHLSEAWQYSEAELPRGLLDNLSAARAPASDRRSVPARKRPDRPASNTGRADRMAPSQAQSHPERCSSTRQPATTARHPSRSVCRTGDPARGRLPQAHRLAGDSKEIQAAYSPFTHRTLVRPPSYRQSPNIHTRGEGHALRISLSDGLTNIVVFCFVPIGTADAFDLDQVEPFSVAACDAASARRNWTELNNPDSSVSAGPVDDDVSKRNSDHVHRRFAPPRSSVQEAYGRTRALFYENSESAPGDRTGGRTVY